jgi:hypothetical protein
MCKSSIHCIMSSGVCTCTPGLTLIPCRIGEGWTSSFLPSPHSTITARLHAIHLTALCLKLRLTFGFCKNVDRSTPSVEQWIVVPLCSLSLSSESASDGWKSPVTRTVSIGRLVDTARSRIAAQSRTNEGVSLRLSNVQHDNILRTGPSD